MKIIRLYKSQRATAWTMVGLGVAALVLGGWGLVMAVKTDQILF